MSRRLLAIVFLLLPLLDSKAQVTPTGAIDTETAAPGPLPPEKAAAGFRLPPGFRATVFAAEPELRNPIAMTWDTRGRLWVAENFTYAELPTVFDLRRRDRVVIFEDADGDGRHDRRTVFTDDVQMLTSVELGRGGVWLLCPPRLLFVPDRDGDDVPDGPPEVVLDGFMTARENHHTFANGLRWGPDGWLYGRCGASSPGSLGPPGTSEARRVPIRGGLWRYHPLKKRVEVVAHGTTNPWGHDWNDRGEGFFINTVNGHLWHLIAGAHFARPHTIEPNPRVYAPIDQHADHYHWDHSRELNYGPSSNPEDDRRGGGHAHCGLLIYQADAWPESFRGKLLTINFHGRRLNIERLERRGSGYVGRHEQDGFFAADPWFRGIDLSCGPDGSVYALDWSDTGECHDHNGVHRSSGRIYKFSAGREPSGKVDDLAALDERGLLDLHGHRNEWFVRQSRRVLADRAARGDDLRESRKALRAILANDGDAVSRLRALWSLVAIGDADESLLRALLDDRDESLRAWAIRLLTDDMPLDTIYSDRTAPAPALPSDLRGRFTAMASDDASGLVRLVLASTLQKVAFADRVALAEALAARAEDASDPNIPSLVWTGLIPVAAASPQALVPLAAGGKAPALLRMITRRLAEELDERPGPANALIELATAREAAYQAEVVAGMAEALMGRRKASRPAAWDGFRDKVMKSSDQGLSARVRDLDVLFGSGRALEAVRRLALDARSDVETRKSALRTLIEARPPDLREICERLIRVRFLNAVALRGLSLFDDPSIGRTLAGNFRSFHPAERPALVATLVSRPAFAKALLDQLEAGKIPRTEVSAFHARQIRGLGSAELSRRLGEVWGELSDLPGDRKARISALRLELSPDRLAGANQGAGRAVFDRVCASCHQLYGQGNDVGPDLTGSGRSDLDYLLENILAPSAVVPADYRMTVVATNDGRILNGLVRAATGRTLTLQTQTEKLTLDRGDVADTRPSELSIMPDGLIDGLSTAERRDLIAYLMHPTQVAYPQPRR